MSGEAPTTTPDTTTTDTPPVAPVEPAAPDIWSMLGGSLFGEMGLNQTVFDYIKNSPEKADPILRGYNHKKEEIQTVGDVASLQIETKMFLFVMSWFSGSKESVAALLLPDELTTKMKDPSFSFDEFQKAHPADVDGLKWAEGATHNHAIWTKPEKLFKLVEGPGSVDFTDATKLADWPNLFPYVPGSRVVVGKSTDLDAVKRLWTEPLKSGDVTLTVLASDVNPLPAPGPREIQVIGMPDLGKDDMKPETWAKLDVASKVWEDGANTQFSGCGRTLAALQMIEYKKTPGNLKTAQEACDAVGYKPAEAEKADFLAWLETAAAPSLPDAASTTSVQSFLTTKLGSLDGVDFTKSFVVKPGEAHFDEFFADMNKPENKNYFPGNATLKKEDVASFVYVPFAGNEALLALNASHEVVGYTAT